MPKLQFVPIPPEDEEEVRKRYEQGLKELKAERAAGHPPIQVPCMGTATRNLYAALKKGLSGTDDSPGLSDAECAGKLADMFEEADPNHPSIPVLRAQEMAKANEGHAVFAARLADILEAADPKDRAIPHLREQANAAKEGYTAAGGEEVVGDNNVGKIQAGTADQNVTSSEEAAGKEKKKKKKAKKAKGTQAGDPTKASEEEGLEAQLSLLKVD